MYFIWGSRVGSIDTPYSIPYCFQILSPHFEHQFGYVTFVLVLLDFVRFVQEKIG